MHGDGQPSCRPATPDLRRVPPIDP
jgi:hypothetical protein